MAKKASFCSTDDPRWATEGMCSDDGQRFRLAIVRPGTPSVLGKLRRKGGRKKKTKEFGLLYAWKNRSVLTFALSRKSALNLRAVLNRLLEDEEGEQSE